MQGNTVLAQPADSGMVRVDPDTNLGVSVSTDCNGRFAKLDPYTGARGPPLVARAATADTATARDSLTALRATRARHVLPGHGEPWRDGIATAVDLALAAPHP